MKHTVLKGIFLVYGVFVAVDMFTRMTRHNKPILQAFLESALIPVHVAGTLGQIAVTPSKYGTAFAIVQQMIADLFDPKAPVTEDIEIGYDALVLLARDSAFSTSVAPQGTPTGSMTINNPEIVQQTDRPASGIGYGLPQQT